MDIQGILGTDRPEEILPLFEFTLDNSTDEIVIKFNLWARFFFPKYFKTLDAPFHREMDTHNIQAYRGDLSSFTDIAFRGAAKTSRVKLLIAFCILNDKTNNGKPFRKYIKVLAKDITNSKQFTTDTYNMFVDPQIKRYYPSTFAKTDAKREETMGSYTTATGVKVLADTVGTDQRGQAQEEARPDWIIFDDFETRKTLRSAVETQAIWDNMKEARDGLSINGSVIFNCNYISERGNVHRLVTGSDVKNIVLITPIQDTEGRPTWGVFTPELIEEIKGRPDTDFAGEYLCQPSASSDVVFDREILDKMSHSAPQREIAGLKVFKAYDASHRYALGADISGGVGLDSSTAVVIDFDVIPCRVVATYKSNQVKPDTFAYELRRIADVYGGCLMGPEKNNMGSATIAILKTLDGVNLLKTPRKDTKAEESNNPVYEYGWNTNGATKPKMTFALKKAVENGLLELTDEDLINEAKSYSRDDLMDREIDSRLSTRHFDLLIAAMIAWQMQETTVSQSKYVYKQQQITDPIYSDIGI